MFASSGSGSWAHEAPAGSRCRAPIADTAGACDRDLFALAHIPARKSGRLAGGPRGSVDPARDNNNLYLSAWSALRF
jgi:hypothetical protein